MVFNAEISVIDRNGNRGRVKTRHEVPISFSDAKENILEPLYDAISSISDGYVVQYRGIWKDELEMSGVDESASDVSKRVLFALKTVNDEYLMFTVPSPSESIFDPDGMIPGASVLKSVCDNIKTVFNAIGVSDPLIQSEAITVVDVVGVRMD